METYLKTYQDYLNEMSETEPTRYKHEKLRKALNKYRNNLKYMLTYQTTKYPTPPIISMEEYSHHSKNYSTTTQELQNKAAKI
jgi:hypothetical protein